MELPNDGVFLVVGNKRYIGYRPFNFKDGTQNEEWLLYEITGAVTNQLPTYQWPESHLSLSNVTLAGTMEELQGVGPNFEQYVNRLLDGLVGNNEARWDGHVQKVLAQAIARPDMSEAEFQNRLRQTPYYQQRTERQIEWNDLSEAERQARIDEVAADVVQHYFTYGGVNLPIGDKWVRHWASQIASGQMGMGEFVEGTLKPHFAKDPNSPQGRRIREEQESRLQRGVDIENLTADLRDIALNEWGFQMSGADLTKWAGYIAENKKSMKDFESTIEQWAKNMFPGIPANTTVRDYAQPYLQIFRQVLERDAPLTNGHIQKALSQGFQNMTTNEFASYLKTLPDWEGTQNAVQELDQMASRAGQLMGFL